MWGRRNTERIEALERSLRELRERPAGDLRPLERRVEQLEITAGKQHIEVLNLMEKVARQLQQRERLRQRVEEEAEAAPADLRSPEEKPGDGQRAPPSTSAHLAQRFRRY